MTFLQTLQLAYLQGEYRHAREQVHAARTRIKVMHGIPAKSLATIHYYETVDIAWTARRALRIAKHNPAIL